ncbi:hypothetical protein [Sphingorhabdus sp.]|uniref:hypothetical protein n=1 Tax=Sphingorhabdus sp. TaxID=1902408 RepID=UPI0032B87C9D
MNNTTATELEFGAAFIGSYMILCARIEEWAASVLISATPTAANGSPAKIPRMLGPKLKAISELVGSEPNPFAKPNRVAELMARFAAPAKLRSDMAHSTLTPVKNGAETVYLFHTVDNGDRFWMTKTDMLKALTELKNLVKEVTDQKIKNINPPS